MKLSPETHALLLRRGFTDRRPNSDAPPLSERHFSKAGTLQVWSNTDSPTVAIDWIQDGEDPGTRDCIRVLETADEKAVIAGADRMVSLFHWIQARCRRPVKSAGPHQLVTKTTHSTRPARW